MATSPSSDTTYDHIRESCLLVLGDKADTPCWFTDVELEKLLGEGWRPIEVDVLVRGAQP